MTDALSLGSHLPLLQAVMEAGQWKELLKTLKVEGKTSRVSMKPLGRDGLGLFKLGGSQGSCECGKVYFHPYRIDLKEGWSLLLQDSSFSVRPHSQFL